MVCRSLAGWRNTISINLSPSRYCPTVEPLNSTRKVWAIDWLVMPNARALSWSTSKRNTLMDSFQLSLTCRVFVFWRMTALSSSAR